MSARAGYTVVLYVVDVSPSMGNAMADPAGTGIKASRLDFAKEYVARRCAPMIQSGRKTDCIGLVTFGGRTNNQANRAWVAENPGDEDAPYAAVCSEVAVQSAKPKTLESVVNMQLGETDGNPISGLMVALDMIRTHKHSKSWTLEIVLVTDGESDFDQDEYEQVMELLDNLGIKLEVVGIDFQDPSLPVEKDKSRNKRLSEKFWRAFVKQLDERVSQTSPDDRSAVEQFCPTLKLFDQELIDARMPQPASVNGTVMGSHLYIGAEPIDAEEAIKIPIKWSKATMKARPPTLSKAWRAGVELQNPSGRAGTQGSQLRSTLSEMQSQAQSQHEPVPEASDLAAIISSDVKRHSMYIVKHKVGEDPASTLSQTQQTQTQTQGSQAQTQTQVSQVDEAAEPDVEEEEEVVDKEDIVKAYKFGASWVPIEADTFEPLQTQKGVEILGFISRKNIQHYMFIGEVRYVWPDITSNKAQIQWSALIQALVTTDCVAITRWVLKDNSAPDIGVGIPGQVFPGGGEKLDFMYWVKLPFADDDHKFFFPSLTKLKTVEGKEVTEHPYLPTQEQCDLMDELVEGLDIDNVDGERWYDPALSYNPVIHRTKEAIFHASITEDLSAIPLPPPHPELIKYFHTPDEVAANVEKVTERLKDALDIKKVTPRARKRAARTDLADDEGFIDEDELFREPGTAPESTQVKAEMQSPVKPKVGSQDNKPDIENDRDFVPTTREKPKPKPGRLISNQQPLIDFKRLVEGEGDVFRKAIQDLAAVVKENVTDSFSRSAFPLALKCLEEMRKTALEYEEVETYNEAVNDLQKTVQAPGFKHPDFWEHFEKAGKLVAPISSEEAQEALEDYE